MRHQKNNSSLTPLNLVKPPLYLYFITHAVPVIAILCLGVCLISGLWYPLSHWVFEDRLVWMPINVWLGLTLVGVPIGVMMAGILTLTEWWQRTSAPIFIKGVIYAVAATLLIAGLLYVVKNFRSYVDNKFPLEISVDVATKNSPNDAPNPYTSLINSGESNTIGGIPISSPSPTNPNRAK